MPWSLDARIPIVFRGDAVCAPETALLLEGDAPAQDGAVMVRFAPGLGRHAADCTCCVARGAVAEALGQLFLARAKGEVGLFSAVAVVCGEVGRAEVLAALAADPVVSARFRLA